MKPDFWKNKPVLITGHTGFKGSWLSMWLDYLGAKVCGYATNPPAKPSLFELASVGKIVNSTIGDIRNYSSVESNFRNNKPEIVFHLAAQSLVRPSYKDPAETFSTNLMGTVNLLEAVRNCESVKAVVIVTSDKCYENKNWPWGYRENDQLGGYDPYSASKACKELITASYRSSFFQNKNSETNSASIATARSGNVIGGGDWAQDRLVPDLIRAVIDNCPAVIRNPLATRPWQHVLEPLCGYITLAESLYHNENNADQAWNFGPEDTHMRTVNDICTGIEKRIKNAVSSLQDPSENPHETYLLKLDSTKARQKLGWKTVLDFEDTMDWTAKWYRSHLSGKDGRKLSINDIESYQHLISFSQ